MIYLTTPKPSCPRGGNSFPSFPLNGRELWGQLSLGVGGGEAEGERAPTRLNNYPHLQE